MKNFGCAFFYFLLSVSHGYAQKVQTIVPRQPVIVGTAFQVQYIISDPDGLTITIPPDFDSLHLVSGPHYYKGEAMINGISQPIENIAYTLVPSKVGVIKIKGLTAQFKNQVQQKSEDAYITVVPSSNASYNAKSGYTDVSLYTPHSRTDLERLINENLFIKSSINKKIIYEGEPVIATFILYSRLQSSSEATKAPGLYGFSMIDMLDINKAHQSVETIKGLVFNTFVLRKVQLYPLQAGDLIIDPMYVHNEIEFEDSLMKGHKSKIERDLSTSPISILVKPLPGKRPDNYTGAVGSFSISARIKRDSIPLDQQGKLIVTISGKGNFIQFGQPGLQLKKTVSFFEPVITDEINNEVAPEQGRRNYEFGFIADSPGKYTLPPVAFSFFDLTTKSFKTIATDSIKFTVIINPARKAIAVKSMNRRRSGLFTPRRRYILLMLTGIVIIVAGIIIILYLKLKSSRVPIQKSTETVTEKSLVEKIELLDTDKLSNKDACFEIQRILTDLLNRKDITIGTEKEKAIKELINECQFVLYSNSDFNSINDLKKRAIKLAEEEVL